MLLFVYGTTTTRDQIREAHTQNQAASWGRNSSVHGQNENSHRDLSTKPGKLGGLDLIDTVGDKENCAEGFKTVYKSRTRGPTFDVLLEEVAKVDPELRVRFTTPRTKDF